MRLTRPAVVPALLLPIVAAAALVLRVDPPGCDDAAPAPNSVAQAGQQLHALPVAFVPNLGQWEHPARYVARFGAMTVFLEDDGWRFTLVERSGANENKRGVAVRMTFAGAGTAELIAESPLPGRHNYFVGKDPALWRSDVPLFGAVRYHEVHPGIDVRAREQEGHFEFDLLLAPGADLEPVEIAVAGVESMHLDGDGTLVLETALGPVRMPAPPSWEEGPGGEKRPIACRYVLRGENRFGFEAPGRRPGCVLVVDPGLVWSTFLGGTRTDVGNAVAIGAQGVVTVIGSTDSTDFPQTAGAFDTTHNGQEDIYVARLSPSGSSLVYSTFLGGTSHEFAGALAVDAQGTTTVVGFTQSTDFPVTGGAFDTSYNGGSDAFVTRLSPNGSSLVYSTFLGGTKQDQAHAVAVDMTGAATVAGHTQSTGFPKTGGAFDTTFNGGIDDAFVARFSSNGSSLIYSTLLGGTGSDQAHAIAVDGNGVATVAGWTDSTDFPSTSGAFDTTFNGGIDDAFVVRLLPNGSRLVYSTFLGGYSADRAWAVAVDAQGVATVAGGTTSVDFPSTKGAFDETFNGGSQDAFVSRLKADGSGLVWSTFLGGFGVDHAWGIAVDARGAANVAGATCNASFPITPGAFDTTHNGATQCDAYVARLSPNGSSLEYSTFLGGTRGEAAIAIALDAQGAATVTGRTLSPDFPTTFGSFDTTFNGNTDAFVTRLDMLPIGVSAYGASSPGCKGPLAISVTSMPKVGNAAFSITCGNTPPSGPGFLAFSLARATTPLRWLGIDIWIDVAPSRLFLLPVQSRPSGVVEVLLPIPGNLKLVGSKVYSQFVWAGPNSPQPCPPLGLSASNALLITIQP